MGERETQEAEADLGRQDVEENNKEEPKPVRLIRSHANQLRESCTEISLYSSLTGCSTHYYFLPWNTKDQLRNERYHLFS